MADRVHEACGHLWSRHTSGPAPPEAKTLTGCLECSCTAKPKGTDAVREATRALRGGMDAPAQPEGWA